MKVAISNYEKELSYIESFLQEEKSYGIVGTTWIWNRLPRASKEAIANVLALNGYDIVYNDVSMDIYFE